MNNQNRVAITSLRHIACAACLCALVALAACAEATSTPTPTVVLLRTQAAEPEPTHQVKATPLSRSPTPEATATPDNTLFVQPTATSDYSWQITDVPVQRTPLVPIQQISWQGDEIAVLYSFDYGVEWLVDAASGQSVEPTPYPTYVPSSGQIMYRVSSSDENYFVECADNELRLYRATNAELLNRTSLTVSDCFGDIAWNPASPFVAILSKGNLYFWHVYNKTPRRVDLDQGYVTMAWSPNGARLLLITGLLEDSRRGFTLVDAEGETLMVKPVEIFWKVFDQYWVTNSVIAILYGCGTVCTFIEYYSASTGSYLTIDAAHISEKTIDLQATSVSPDGRWFVFDHSTRKGQEVTYRYDLLDAQAGRIYSLASSQTEQFAFTGWAEDSSIFYLVSRPVSETAKASAATPFGLLALNPETREFTQLFDQAVFAEFSPDKQLAWVVFPAKRDDSTLGLDGGIFSLTDKTLIGRQYVSDHILYANPAEGDLVPMAWSNDGTRLVFGDSQGNLILLSTDGAAQTLATNLPHDPETWPKNVQYAWSPDDAHLLVQYGDQVWIVSVP